MDLCVERLRDASFRGVSFLVETDDETVGRRLITHEYPKRDDPLHEDMGEKFRSYKVKGYVHGGAAIEWKNSVVAACRLPGPALLVLPAIRPFMARCVNLTVTRNKDKQGWFDLSFDFRAEDNGGFDLTFAIGAAEMLLGTLVGGLAKALGSILADRMKTTNVLQYVTASATTRTRAFAASIASAIETTPLTYAEAGSAMTLKATTLYANAEAITKSPAALVDYVSTMLSSLTDGAEPADAMAAVKAFITFESEVPDDAGIASVSETANAENAALFNGAVRALALAYYGQAITRATLSTRSEAMTLRADFVEACNAEINSLSFDEDATVAMTEVRDTTVDYISRSVVNAVPVIEITAPASMPALYWANRLYADPTRADEIVARNGMIDPAFTPTVFEALAR